MTELEKEIFRCQSKDLLSYLVLPMLKISSDTFGEDYFKTYLSFSGKIIVTASKIRDTFKFYLHENYLLNFREMDKIYVVFNHPKEFEDDIVSIIHGRYSALQKSTINTIKLYSGMPEDYPVYGGGKYTHPILAALKGNEKLREKLVDSKLDYKGELLPPLNLYDDLLDIDTIIL